MPKTKGKVLAALTKQDFTGKISDVIDALDDLANLYGYNAVIVSLPVSKKGGFQLVSQ